MKILYITDVDGTLTRESNLLSEETAQLMRKVLETGVNLTIATGRSINGTADIVERCGIVHPVIVLNGAMIYDLYKSCAVKLFSIKHSVAKELCRIYENTGVKFTASIFISEDQRCKSYCNYEKTYPWAQRAINPKNGLYHDERIQVARILPYLEEGECLYMGSAGSHQQITAAQKEMSRVSGINGYCHQSPYESDKWFLDVVAEDSGKGVAALYLKDYFKAEELVTFGDNHNDIPMLKVADRSYTVPQAPPEVLLAADGVLDNSLNAVPNFFLGSASALAR